MIGDRMDFKFNMLLDQALISKEKTLLLRHTDPKADPHRTIYQLWREDRASFEEYQRHQTDNLFNNSVYWASFIVTPNAETMFVGVYQVLSREPSIVKSDHIYSLQRLAKFENLEGRLFVDWGKGFLSWVQRAENQDKMILELRPQFVEDTFPGFKSFIEPLSRVDKWPSSWQVALSANRGIYLLTCPRTKELYVGKAEGVGGFLGRWREYFANGHGGNLGLQSREPSDYQISILEVAGSEATAADISNMETLWKRKLRSRDMGLNKN